MKKTSILMGVLLFIGCGQESKDNSTSQQDINNTKVKEELFSEKGKEFLEFAIKDEFETLSDGGDVQITEYYPLYTAEKITSDYDKNEIRANNLYKDKQFFITGAIGGIEAGIDDKPVVNLKTNANYGFNSPLLKFNKIDQGKVAELNKGDKVTFLCTGNSEIAGSPILEDCIFLKTFEKQILDDALKFEDKDLSGKNSQYKQAVFTYAVSTLGLSKVSNDFEKCKVVDTTCIAEISKTVKKEDVQKTTDELKAQFPKAIESKEKLKHLEK